LLFNILPAEVFWISLDLIDNTPNDSSQFTEETYNNYVQNMINGGEHFDDVQDEELVREQFSPV
jgi:hypothetical protein